MTFSSGLNVIDALAYSSWNKAPHTSANVTYSFLSIVPAEATTEDALLFAPLTLGQQQAVHDVFEMWSSIANITFVDVTDAAGNNGQIRFGTNDQKNESAGYSDLPNYGKIGSFVYTYFSNTYNKNFIFSPGTYGLTVFLHEIGHALGLKHPGNYNGTDGSGTRPYLPTDVDNTDYSLMSYNDGKAYLTTGQNPITPMLYDISALQYLYGANTSWHTGNDVYRFDNFSKPQSVWDAGGNNTFDFSATTLGVTIDLHEGAFSESRPGAHNISIAYGVTIQNAIGGTGDDKIYANDGNVSVSSGAGDDQIWVGSGLDNINGGSGNDTILFNHTLSNYTLSRNGDVYTVLAKTGITGTDTITNVETLKFSDLTVNLTIRAIAATAPQENVNRLMELYVAFFNRVPDADGLAYWIGQMGAGQKVNQIAETFYGLGVQFSTLTGFSATMSNADFINLVYKNVLGRSAGADTEGLNYWNAKLLDGSATHGSLVSTILDAAHGFKGDVTWGWVANLLDNKITVAKTFSIDMGLGYALSSDSITHGMAIAAAVTPIDTAAALSLIGIAPADINLI